MAQIIIFLSSQTFSLAAWDLFLIWPVLELARPGCFFFVLSFLWTTLGFGCCCYEKSPRCLVSSRLHFRFYRFFSSGPSMTAMVLESPGSTRSIGLSPSSVRMWVLAPLSINNLVEKRKKNVSSIPFLVLWFLRRPHRIVDINNWKLFAMLHS